MPLIDFRGYPTVEIDEETAETYICWEDRWWEVFWDARLPSPRSENISQQDSNDGTHD